MGQLLGGAGREDLLGEGGRVGRGTPFQVLAGEPEQQSFAQQREPGAPVVGPARVAVLREHLTGEPFEGAGQFTDPAVGEGRAGRCLGRVGVDPHGRGVEVEERSVGDEVRGGGARGEFGFEGVARGVQGDPQTARGGLRIGVGPADGHRLFAVQAMRGRHGEEFHQGPGAGTGPSFGECGAAVPGGPKAVEKVQPEQRRGRGRAVGRLLRTHQGVTVAERAEDPRACARGPRPNRPARIGSGRLRSDRVRAQESLYVVTWWMALFGR